MFGNEKFTFNFLIFCIYFLYLVENIFGQRIILDKDFPMIVNKPYLPLNDPIEISINFRFDYSKEKIPLEDKKEFQGLLYKQFIGIVFPVQLGDSDLLFDASIKHSCKLTNQNKDFKMSSVLNEKGHINNNLLADSFIAYCRLDDIIYNLDISESLFTFSISLNFNKILSTNYVNGISLIISISNNPEGIIIDSLPLIGTLALYSNYINSITKPLVINSVVIVLTNNKSNLIFPYSNFDMTLTISSIQFISTNDNLIVFKFPFESFNFPEKIVLLNDEGIETDVSFNVMKIGTDSFSLIENDNFVLNFPPGSQIKLIIKNWKALDYTQNTNKNLELVVYYKNTNSIMSYHSLNSALNLNKGILNLNVKHPENWDIYRNGAWPFKFSFQSNVDLLEGGWILIQHTNALNDGPIGNKISFIASTCDFSENENFDNNLGKRPKCYPLRLDHNYPNNSATVPYKASGIFFKFQFQIQSSKVYHVIIWAFADNCAGTTTDPVNANSFIIPQFQISIYKKIDESKMNESRINIINVISDSNITSFQGKCWNNRMQGVTTLSPYSFNLNILNTIKLDGLDNSLIKPGITLYKEIYDWQILSTENCADCWSRDMSNIKILEKFIYSNNNKISDSSYFMIRFQLKRSQTPFNDMLLNYIPTPYTSSNNLLPGRLIIQFSKIWFQSGDSFKGENPTCFFSWGAYDNIGGIDSQKKLFYTQSEIAIQNQNSNFISANLNQFDYNLSYLPSNMPEENNKDNIMRLVSTFNPGTMIKKDFNWKYFSDFYKNGVNNSNKIQIGFFNSCVKWKKDFPLIKSMYSYIDIQVQWTYITNREDKTLGNPINNLRMIKLFPEGGVFNDFSENYNSNNINPFINHFAYGINSITNGVCLIELQMGNTIQNLNSNSFVIFLMFGILIESDYSDLASNYPVGNLKNNVEVFGAQSASAMSQDNLYVSNINTGYKNIANIRNEIFKENLKSSYIFYMGSTLIFTNIKDNSLSNQINNSIIFIPYYCPLFNQNNYDMMPSLIGTWMNRIGNNNDNVLGVTNPLYYIDKNSDNTISVILSRNSIKSTYVASVNTNLIKLRFSPYTSNISNVLYVFNPNQINYSCTGHSLFFSNQIKIEENINFNTNYEGSKGMFIKNNFYIFGKQFNKAFFYGLDTTQSIIMNNDISFTGVIRPNLENILKFDTLIDKIGYFCSSSNLNEVNYTSNYVSNISRFILDWNPDLLSDWIIKINLENNNQFFNNDPSGNIKINLDSPSIIPIGAQIKIIANLIKSTTKCGLRVSDQIILLECNIINNEITCDNNFSKSFQKFEIICYNININQNNPNFSISQLSAIFPNYDASLFNYISNLIYDSTNQIKNNPNIFSYKLLNENFINLEGGSLDSINYFYSNQEGGLGTAKIKISLPREISYNMKITIQGDFSNLLIRDVKPNCQINFDQDIEGIILMDSCNVDLMSNTPIIILTKNIIYNNLNSYGKILYVTLTPILIYNYKNTENKFIIKIETLQGEALSFNSQISTIKLETKINIKNSVISNQWDYLCYVTNITPKIPYEVADYQFEIDLDSNKSLNYNLELNEILIFISIELYGKIQSNIICIYNNLITPCRLENQILIIRFTQSLVIYNNKKVIVIVSGLINPAVDSDIIFPCSVNSYDYESNTRISVISGSGRFLGGINFNNIIIKGNLLFMKPDDSHVSDKFIRNISTHFLRIGFDFANTITPSLFTISGSPILNISFPDEYKLGLNQSQTKPIVKIWEITRIINKKIKSTIPILPIIILSGNRLQLTIPKANYLINSLIFVSWDIEISNIPNPDVIITTGPFNIHLTNSLNNLFIKSHSNLNTFTGEKIKNSSNNFLTYHKGISFYTNPIQFILDIFTEINQPNILMIKSGRFNLAYFLIKNNPIAPPAMTTLTLTDPLFKTSESKYIISSNTHMYFPISFYIGCTCATPTATFYINFVSSDKVSFSGMIPIKVNVVNSFKEKFKISFKNEIEIFTNSTAWIFYKLSEFNFDPLEIKWKSDLRNDKNLTLSNITLSNNVNENKKFSFSFLNYTKYDFDEMNLQNPQNFTIEDPNKCYTFSNNKTLNVRVVKNKTEINFDYYKNNSITNYFEFYNSDFDNNTIDKTSLKFIFIPNHTPIYINCVLVCEKNNFPFDDEILNSNLELNTNLLQYYKNYIYDKNAVDIKFNNLIRGLRYKMKCIVKSTQVENADGINFIFNSNATVTENINTFIHINVTNLSATFSQETRCINFKFMNLTDIYTKIAMINYCQRLFVEKGFYENGCIICTDEFNNYTVPGLNLPTNYYCGMTRKNRQLQLNNNDNLLEDSFSYSICIIQDPLCKTNITEENISLIFSKLKNNLNSKENFQKFLNISNVNIINENNFVNDYRYDDFKPNIVYLNITNITSDLNGTMSWITKYEYERFINFKNNTINTNITNNQSYFKLLCYWKVQSKFMTMPNENEIRQCTDLITCGNHKLDNKEQIIKNVNINNKVFSGRNYNIYYVCYNDVPGASLNSEVKLVGNFNFDENENLRLFNSGGIKLINYLNEYMILLIFLII